MQVLGVLSSEYYLPKGCKQVSLAVFIRVENKIGENRLRKGQETDITLYAPVGLFVRVFRLGHEKRAVGDDGNEVNHGSEGNNGDHKLGEGS